ncbi:NifB/NifX family molybdenum-iron cluster-binding protein [Pyrofollis japonicus]|uniref:NifB/NifX family molybdenum-iron cluster-binding protein n=1 Tax=Pyrofollis japonicus TaxID=3060460 RepID=UPI00295B8640|nr:NifB/NifX family molybdenum-iron cluster-binding protein [Pyrofollis japonicus]BEP17757.1 NifB/NifX family molybdenum-iron cluster-binding protein [Pyrofollis japonicus]
MYNSEQGTRIAIPVLEDRGLDSVISEHFGRAPYFLIIDIRDGKIINVEKVANSAAENHAPGEIPLLLRELGVNVVIVRGIGRRAAAFFEEYGIEVVSGADGPVKDIIQAYIDGMLQSREYKPMRRWREKCKHREVA